MNMSPAEVAACLKGADDAALFAEARRLRTEVFGTEVYLRGIVEFSSVCDKRCLYCGLRAPNAGAERYRLDTDAILETSALAPELGLGTVVLQAGDDPAYDADMICAMVREIKARHDVAVTLSLGERPVEELALFRRAGADRYLLKLETTDVDFYARMRPGERFATRLAGLKAVQAHGFEAGSGVITDLPGMDVHALARDIVFISGLDLDMVAVGPFVPHPDTPLGGEPPGGLDRSLRVLAVLRLLNPRANIPATSALDALAPDGRERGLMAGANVLMPSITPDQVRGSYRIYPGKNEDAARVRARIADMKDMVRGLGLNPSPSKGFSPRSRHEP